MKDHPETPTQTLADLIGSRLCHDIVNPLGAIGNGVELLEMSGGAAGPELELIRDAVQDAQAKVRFFRVAFGAASGHQIVSAREARDIATAPYRQTRLNPEWRVTEELPRTQLKLAYLMILCAEAALPMGGDLVVHHQSDGHWRIECSAQRVTLDEALWSTLRFGAPSAERALRPSEVQFAALHDLVTANDLTVNFVATDTSLTITTS